MSNQFVILAGPTATGKTSLAIQLVKFFPLRFISADSRQVYRQADIVPGKDHPQDVDVAGVDLCHPCQSSSVSLWFKSIVEVANLAWRNHQLPFFVGGTGFYLQSLTSNIETLHIPPNPKLRLQLQTLSLSQLQSKLQSLNSSKFNLLNHSDKLNPRRLIRAIEVSLYQKQYPNKPVFNNPFLKSDYLFFLLQPSPNHCQLIRQRVIQRLQQGAIQETQQLLKLCQPQAQVFQSLGYASIMAYLNNQVSYSELIEDWVLKECQYVKRQITWFKKQPQTIKLSSNSPHLLEDIVKHLKTWYH